MRRYNTKTRRYCIFLAVILLLVSWFIPNISNILAEEQNQAEIVSEIRYGYNIYGLNIRKEMDIESEWIGQYPGRSTIVILEDMGDWYRVENGYVMKEFVFDSIEIYERGKVLEEVVAFAEPNYQSQVVAIVEKDVERICIWKENGFVLMEDIGYVPEAFVTFYFEIQPEIKPNTLNVDDMKTWRMASLPIQYIGTLEKRTGGKGVTNRNTLYFKDVIPIYDIIDGEAYFPSGRHIYKISIDKFIEIENVGPSYEILAAYRTIYYDSSSARKHNIELVSTFLDGTVISYNKTFSYNKTTGSRSQSKGYLEAPVIENGQYVPGFGGGVCQVSSTIYAAIMNQPWFNVTERRPHGLEVSYLPYGMDATVSYGSIDLKFINEYPFAVKLNVKSEDGVCLVTITRVSE